MRPERNVIFPFPMSLSCFLTGKDSGSAWKQRRTGRLIFGESEVSIMDEERKRRNRRKKWKDWLGSWLMILPALCFLLVFTIYPMLNIVRLSFLREMR